MFQSYEREVEAIVGSIEDRLDQVQDFDSDARSNRTLLKQVEADLTQVHSVLKQMEVEARSGGGDGKSMKSAVRRHKARVRSLRDTFEKVKSKSERDDLMSSRGGGGYDERDRYERVTARMAESTDTLLQSKRTLAETEEVALGITEQLGSNRQTILSAHGKVRETGGMVGSAYRILRGMQRRATRQKLLLWFIMFCLVIGMLWIIISAFKKDPEPTASPTIAP